MKCGVERHAPIKALLLPVLCLVLGACGGPVLSLKYEQRYTVRDENRLFGWVKAADRFGESPAICIPWTGLERLPWCSQPWEHLFDLLPIFDGPHNRYLQGQFSVETLASDGAAGVRALCSSAEDQFELTSSQRRAIAAAANTSGFFDFPADLSKLPYVRRPDGLDTIVVRDTCWTSDLELSLDGHRNRVQWSCDTAVNLGQDDAQAPQQIQPLLAAIENAYAAHVPVKVLLPFAQCPTMLEELARRENAQR